MDKYVYRYKELLGRWEEYRKLQAQLKKSRRDVLIGACIACLLVGFMAGVFVAYPRERTVQVTIAEPQPETRQAATHSL